MVSRSPGAVVGSPSGKDRAGTAGPEAAAQAGPAGAVSSHPAEKIFSWGVEPVLGNQYLLISCVCCLMFLVKEQDSDSTHLLPIAVSGLSTAYELKNMS